MYGMSMRFYPRLAVAMGQLFLVGLCLTACVQRNDLSTDDVQPQPFVSASGVDMVFLSGGTFMMGSNEGDDDERPLHQVILSPFVIDVHEVTHEMFARAELPNPSRWQDDPQKPVESVRWRDAKIYCNERSLQEGLEVCYDETTPGLPCDFKASGYRLPTEAEWEFACRAGSQGDYVCTTSDKLKSYAYYNANSDNQTQPVGTRKANRWGLFGMHGNVCEWCQDVYDPEYYQISPTLDPRGPSTSAGDVKRVIRGGSWKASVRMCRSSFRQGQRTGDTDACFSTDYCGFRCVRRMAIETWNLLQKNQVENEVTTPKANSSDSK